MLNTDVFCFFVILSLIAKYRFCVIGRFNIAEVVYFKTIFAESVTSRWGSAFWFPQCLISDMHLTNVAVQKTAPDYDPEKVCNKRTSKQKCMSSSETLPLLRDINLIFLIVLFFAKGCKWQMQKLRTYLTAKHGRERVENLFKEMDNIFICTLQSVQKIIINDKHCFELYGYDILLDQNLKP